MRRFELPTPWSVAKCSIQLSYTHTLKDCSLTTFNIIHLIFLIVNSFFYLLKNCFNKKMNAGDRNRTGTKFNPRRILSPVRLPVPPRRHSDPPYLAKANGWRWIRTTEACRNRFTVCPLWPLGNPSLKNLTIIFYIILFTRKQDVFHE